MNKISKYVIKVENITFTCGYTGEFEIEAQARGGDAWLFNDDMIARQLSSMIHHDHEINCSTCHPEVSDREIEEEIERF